MSFFAIKELDLHIIYDCDLYDWKKLAFLNCSSYRLMNTIRDYRTWVIINQIAKKNLKYFGYNQEFTWFEQSVLNCLTPKQKREKLDYVIDDFRHKTKYLLFDEACRFESLYILKYFAPKIQISDERLRDMMVVCGKNDNLHIFRWLMELDVEKRFFECSYPLHFSEVWPFYEMMRYGSFSIIEWMIDYFRFEDHVLLHMFKIACHSNNIKVAKFVLDKSKVDIFDYLYNIFKDVCVAGCKEVAEWLLQLGPIDITFNNYEIYRLVNHNDIKCWLSELICDLDIDEKNYVLHMFGLSQNLYGLRPSWLGYSECLKCPQKIQKRIKIKEKHPQKIVTKRPIRKDKFHR
uniref:Ankyrin repeat protein n=1 Tax=viral metagenome TaxID=1070528 RepID=A0A6C0C8F4_9ZZZZ